jgi:Flp pilus assembly protein TadG
MAALMLCTLFVGIVYGGIMAYDNVVLTNAVATGVRTLATESGDSTACTDATNAITSTAYGLKTSQLTIVPQSSIAFLSISNNGSSGLELGPDATASCSNVNGGDYAVMWASYPCSMYFPRLGINLCTVSTSSKTVTYSPCQSGSGVTCSSTIDITVTCPSPPCNYTIQSARISGTGGG